MSADGAWNDVAEMNALSRKSTPKSPKPGERWRVTVEGTVRGVNAGSRLIDLDTMRACGIEAVTAVYLDEGTWERLPDPEPYWESGDLVLDADGFVWQRGPAGQTKCWYRPNADLLRETPVKDDYPARPLIRLVPEEAS